MMANRIFYRGATLPEFKVGRIGLVAMMLFAVLGPMLAFGGQLEAAKRTDLRELSILAQRYAQENDRKWLRGAAPRDEPLVGSAGIQSLADLGNRFEVVKEMRWGAVHDAHRVPVACHHADAGTAAHVNQDSLEELLEKLLPIIF